MLKRPSTATTEAQENPLDIAEGKAPEAVVNSASASAKQAREIPEGAAIINGQVIRSLQDIKHNFNGVPFDVTLVKKIMSFLMQHEYTRDKDSEAVKKGMVVMATEDDYDSNERIVVQIGRHWQDQSKLMFRYEVHTMVEYRVKVRQYMTKSDEDGSWDFMEKWNQGQPMPMRVMVGRILEETKGMYRMTLHGRPEPSTECLHCGRTLKHPVSLLYGIGPICGQHFHINPLGSEEALQAAYEAIRANLAAVTWTGWIPKSAIQSWDALVEEVHGDARVAWQVNHAEPIEE